MILYVKNIALETLGVVDVYSSIIWTKRYYSAGDFELYLPATADALQLLQIGNILTRPDDDRVMLIEKINISTDVENGNFLTVSGRSIECILSRRIVWNLTTYSGTVEGLIRKLVSENAINSDTRGFDNFVLSPELGLEETITKQITGDNLYEVIVELCTEYKYGWRITLQNDVFTFELYKGENRSYYQDTNPYVVFSPEYDNLINSNYEIDTSNYANVALVAGEGEGVDRKTHEVGTATGWDRYEIFVDAKNTSSNTEEELTTEQYIGMLDADGREQLAESAVTEAFEGEAETSTYQYKSEWDIGDIVQVVNEYGVSASPRIVEVVESDDDSGYVIVPTWESKNLGEYIPGKILIDQYGYVLRDSSGMILTVEG